MFYRIKNDEIYDYADYKYASDCLETNVISQLELDEHPEKVIVQNGEIVLNPNWDDIELDEAKQAKISQNDLIRDIALNQGVIYKDVLFDSDTDQKVNLLATLTMLEEGQTVIWYGMDNQPLECDDTDLSNIGDLITQLHSYCWNKNAFIKTEIENAATVEEVNAIEINYEMEE